VRGKKRTGGDWIGGERRRKEKRGEEARRQDTKGLRERRGSLISGWGYFRCCRCRFVSIIKKLENGKGRVERRRKEKKKMRRESKSGENRRNEYREESEPR
jgi:hypothetical protein